MDAADVVVAGADELEQALHGVLAEHAGPCTRQVGGDGGGGRDLMRGEE